MQQANSKNTITFTRAGYNEYVDMLNAALAAGHSSFVHKGTLIPVDHAQRLVKLFEKHFTDTATNKVTIPYTL